MPRDAALRKYAKLFEVPYPWLKAGRGEAPFLPIGKFEGSEFEGRIMAACDHANKSPAQLVEHTGQALSTLRKYMSVADYHKDPLPENVAALAGGVIEIRSSRKSLVNLGHGVGLRIVEHLHRPYFDFFLDELKRAGTDKDI